MAAGAAAAAIVGTGVQMIGQRKQAKAQKKAAETQAAAKRTQAEEVLKRSKINIERTKGQAEDVRSKQLSAFVAGGVDISSVATVQQNLALQEDLLENIMDQEREANFVAMQLEKGADIDTRLAGDIDKSSKLSMIGQGISGGVGAFKTYRAAKGD